MKVIISISLLCIFCISSFAQVDPLPPRPGIRTYLAPFYHGVASGDPLSDRVIIWTRVTPTVAGTVNVNWQMATDTLFAHIVTSGTVSVDSNTDYTVKVDVTGLTDNTWYYYRFKTGSTYSMAGRTRTLPVGNTDSIRLAVYSCSDFQTGFFNAYRDIAGRNDIDAIVHLGDYYYEYLAGGSDYSGDTSRMHPLTHDALSLGDYRLWESQYKLDSDLAALHEQYPAIQVWDDHEIANNGWYSGAQNHNPATQGSWFVRKAAAKRAYFEWNPIREIATGNDSIIHRSFQWGNLMNLIMLDTRFEGRDSSLGSLLSPTNAYMIDTNRKMLGTAQLAWLKGELNDTSTQWKIIGSQVMTAPLTLFGSVLNGDQWDGYPAERLRVFRHIASNNIKDVVFLSGDIHSSWANDLPDADSTYTSSTGMGSIATEFIGSSITSTATAPGTTGIIMATNPWCKYIDFSKRGYLLFDVNKTRAQGDFIHISTTASRTFTSSDDEYWVNLDNERHLRIASAPLGPNPGNPPLVSPFPIGSTTGIQQASEKNFVVFTCYPNPAFNEIIMQYYLNQPNAIYIIISDMSGRLVYNKTTTIQPQGVSVSSIDVAGLAPGAYLVSMICGNESHTLKLLKK